VDSVNAVKLLLIPQPAFVWEDKGNRYATSDNLMKFPEISV